MADGLEVTNVNLIHGNCIEVLKQIKDESVDAVITDPPYGISYKSNWKAKEEQFDVIDGDDSVPVDWIYEAYRVTKPNGCLFMFCRWDTSDEFKKSLIDAEWNVRSQVIWDRVVHGMGDLESQFAPMHDNIWFAIKGSYKFPSDRPKSVYTVKRISGDQLLHPNQKPLGLMGRILIDITKKGDVVLDPFMGSGSTAVACARNDRDFIGIEINKKYYDVAVDRVAQEQKQPQLF